MAHRLRAVTQAFFSRVLPAIVSNPSVTKIKLPKHSRRTRSKRAAIDASCTQTMTPLCLQEIYNIPATPATAPGNSIGVSGFANEVANQTDLQVPLSLCLIVCGQLTNRCRDSFRHSVQTSRMDPSMSSQSMGASTLAPERSKQ